MLNSVGLNSQEMKRRVLKLSGGQQQRVATARSMVYSPDIILADEPTGNLDPENQKAIIEIFIKLAHELNKCVILVTHSPEVADMVDEVCKLQPEKNQTASLT